MNFQGLPRKFWTNTYTNSSATLIKLAWNVVDCERKMLAKFRGNIVQTVDLIFGKTSAIIFEKLWEIF